MTLFWDAPNVAEEMSPVVFARRHSDVSVRNTMVSLAANRFASAVSAA
jgi:hypothetical protein